jgi:3-hydroxybutyryl-CoA dehydrogenase
MVELIRAAGIEVVEEPGDSPRIELDNRVALAVSDGRTATERLATDGGKSLVLVDLALDYASASRLAVTKADQASEADIALVAGLCQAMGKAVSVIDDVPGMIVTRTVCMLANEGADAVNQGVCSASAVDTAMRGGVNYPQGPLAWAANIGIDTVVQVLSNLAASYGEDRYRLSPWLRRKLYSGEVLS